MAILEIKLLTLSLFIKRQDRLQIISLYPLNMDTKKPQKFVRSILGHNEAWMWSILPHYEFQPGYRMNSKNPILLIWDKTIHIWYFGWNSERGIITIAPGFVCFEYEYIISWDTGDRKFSSFVWERAYRVRHGTLFILDQLLQTY